MEGGGSGWGLCADSLIQQKAVKHLFWAMYCSVPGDLGEIPFRSHCIVGRRWSTNRIVEQCNMIEESGCWGKGL